MSARATFLHITDMHVAAAAVPFPRDSMKLALPAVSAGTRQEAVELLFKRVAERLVADKIKLDGVLFSGDAQDRAKAGGHEFVLKQLKDHLGPLGLPLDCVVSVPGNHDVSRTTLPSSPERYKNFLDVWSDAGCIVPWLDGVDTGPGLVHPEKHRLVASDGSWAIYPINTSNWSNFTRLLPERLREIWHAIPMRSANGDDELAALIKEHLDSMTRYDMPRVSKEQLEALRAIVASTPAPPSGNQVRIAVMHHHLRSPGLSEELKPFADMSNLEQVRAFLRDSRMDLVLHGHKHEQATYYEHVPGDSRTQRMFVVSGGTFEVGREHDSVRLITLEGLPYTPQVRIEPIPLPRSGASSVQVEPVVRRLWSANTQAFEGVVAAGPPIMIEGSDLDEVYARALDLAKSDAKRGILIIHLDLPDDDGKTLPLPRVYPVPPDVGNDERQAWLRDLVEWWQLGRSQLEPRIRICMARGCAGMVARSTRSHVSLRSWKRSRARALLRCSSTPFATLHRVATTRNSPRSAS